MGIYYYYIWIFSSSHPRSTKADKNINWMRITSVLIRQSLTINIELNIINNPPILTRNGL